MSNWNSWVLFLKQNLTTCRGITIRIYALKHTTFQRQLKNLKSPLRTITRPVSKRLGLSSCVRILSYPWLWMTPEPQHAASVLWLSDFAELRVRGQRKTEIILHSICSWRLSNKQQLQPLVSVSNAAWMNYLKCFKIVDVFPLGRCGFPNWQQSQWEVSNRVHTLSPCVSIRPPTNSPFSGIYPRYYNMNWMLLHCNL